MENWTRTSKSQSFHSNEKAECTRIRDTTDKCIRNFCTHEKFKQPSYQENIKRKLK